MTRVGDILSKVAKGKKLSGDELLQLRLHGNQLERNNSFSASFMSQPVNELAPETDYGWTMVIGENWFYYNANTFKVAADADISYSPTYPKGARVRWKQGAGYKYGVVIGQSPNIVNGFEILVNTDYVITNAEVTDMAYSLFPAPANFPGWFNFNAQAAGWSALPTINLARYTTVGKTMHLAIAQDASGTSNATTMQFTAPVISAAVTNMSWQTTWNAANDNSTALTAAGRVSLLSGSQTINCYSNMALGAWTNANIKRIVFQLDYEW